MILADISFVAIGLIIGININLKRAKPVYTVNFEKSWTVSPGVEAMAIENNYWNFIDASYIIIGTQPNCQYYKILSGVPRNDYDRENFYIEDESSYMYYHDEEGNRQSSVVVDVSAYQGNIDWAAVKEAGVSMAIVRVGFRGYGSGKLVYDEMYERNIQGALNAGLRVGVYFFTQAVDYAEGQEEALYVLDAISVYDIDGPVVIDTEYVSEDSRTNGLDVDGRTDAVLGFCETVEAMGYEPAIYANRNWFVQSLDMSKLYKYKIWVAAYSNQIKFPYEFSGWQYTNSGSVPGISTEVDMNVWFE
ncbi:MAG: glycoside hydrolase family 25 protein [Wujia sp.]